MTHLEWRKTNIVTVLEEQVWLSWSIIVISCFHQLSGPEESWSAAPTAGGTGCLLGRKQEGIGSGVWHDIVRLMLWT